VRGKLIIGVAGGLAVALAGGFFWRCWAQTVCVVNGEVAISGQSYQIDKERVFEFVQKYKREDRVRQVWLWVDSGRLGFNQRRETANRPVWIETRVGQEGKALLRSPEGESIVSVRGESGWLHHRLILFYRPERMETVSAGMVNQIFKDLLKWHIWTDDWSNEDEMQLLKKI
jgi:hypothetical protein